MLLPKRFRRFRKKENEAEKVMGTIEMYFKGEPYFVHSDFVRSDHGGPFGNWNTYARLKKVPKENVHDFLDEEGNVLGKCITFERGGEKYTIPVRGVYDTHEACVEVTIGSSAPKGYMRFSTGVPVFTGENVGVKAPMEFFSADYILNAWNSGVGLPPVEPERDAVALEGVDEAKVYERMEVFNTMFTPVERKVLDMEIDGKVCVVPVDISEDGAVLLRTEGQYGVVVNQKGDEDLKVIMPADYVAAAWEDNKRKANEMEEKNEVDSPLM